MVVRGKGVGLSLDLRARVSTHMSVKFFVVQDGAEWEEKCGLSLPFKLLSWALQM